MQTEGALTYHETCFTFEPPPFNFATGQPKMLGSLQQIGFPPSIELVQQSFQGLDDEGIHLRKIVEKPRISWHVKNQTNRNPQ